MFLPLIAVALRLSDSTSLCVRDAATRQPLRGTEIAVIGEGGRAVSSRITKAECVDVPRAIVRIRHVGYHTQLISVGNATAIGAKEMVVDLRPLLYRDSSSPQVLATQEITASRSPSSAGRTRAVVSVADARASGVGTTAELLAMLPFVSVRSARGETGISLRGARREQVAITLDGMLLNDPATGIADVSDMPLASLGSAAVVLGADPLGAGPGANGGVVALESAPQRVLAFRAGAFDARSVEGAWHASRGRALWQAGASHRRATNDFAFRNDAGATGTSVGEVRVNNDEQRTTLSLGVVAATTQLALFASTGERGMVGPMNVRTYDADRSRTKRLLLRGRWTGNDLQVTAGTRAFALAYRDPTRPALNADARAIAGDVEVNGRVGLLAWRAGGGADQLHASGGLEQRRGRGFAATDYERRSSGGSVNAGVRVDAIGALGVLPSFSIAGERVVGVGVTRRASLTLGARLSQAVRAPTLYDLYFSSPQRIVVRALRPERVLVDGEVQSRYTQQSRFGVWSLQGSLVARDTRDAIVWFPGNFGWSPANVGRERLRGGEAQLRLEPAWGAISAWFTLYDAVLHSGQLAIPTPYVARVAGGGQLRVALPLMTATLLVHAMGPRPYTAGPRNAAFELRPTTLIDVSASRRVAFAAVDVLLALSIDNATNVRWQSVRGFPSPGRSWAISTTLRHTDKS